MVNPGTNSFLSKDLIEWREGARERQTDRQTDRQRKERERERERERGERERERERENHFSPQCPLSPHTHFLSEWFQSAKS